MLIVTFTTPVDLTALLENADAVELGLVRLNDRFVFAGLVDVTFQDGGTRAVIDGDEASAEVLALRSLVLLTGQQVAAYSVADEAGFLIGQTAGSADIIPASLSPSEFVSAVDIQLGRKAATNEEAADGNQTDLLLDWGAETLQAAGFRNELGFQSFQRHRILVHSEGARVFQDAAPIGRTREIPNWTGLVFENFLIAVENKGQLNDGRTSYLGYVYFYLPLPETHDDPGVLAEYKIRLLSSLVTAFDPYLTSDLKQRSVGVTAQGGAWIQAFDWQDDGRVIVTDEFVQP